MNQENRMLSVWVHTSDYCNLDCAYCPFHTYEKLERANLPSAHMMHPDTLRCLNERMLELLRYSIVDQVIYRIGGGEPSITTEYWIPAIEELLIKTEKNRVILDILTNLYKPSEEFIQFLLKWKERICLTVSYDGTGWVSVRNGSGAKVKENILSLLKRGFPYHHIGISTVLVMDDATRMIDVAELVYHCDLNWNISLDHFFDTDAGIEAEHMLQFILDALDYLKEMGFDIVHKVTFQNWRADRSVNGCHPGQNMIAVDCNGDVYACHSLIPETRDRTVFNVKNPSWLQQGFPSWINCPTYTPPRRCMSCEYGMECNGGCKCNPIQDPNVQDLFCVIIKTVYGYLAKLKGEDEDAQL